MTNLRDRTFLTKKWEVVLGRCHAIIKLDTPRSILSVVCYYGRIVQ